MNNRYIRNIACIGTEGQRRLSDASVFIIGCGALGGQVAMLLAGAGVGRIGISDFDTIDISNLQRQLFFSEAEEGKSKCDILSQRMRNLNSEISIDVHSEKILPDEARKIFSQYSFIIDATDSPATKYMTDYLCGSLGVPGCIAGVDGWRGQIMCVSGDASDGTIRFSHLFPPPESEKDGIVLKKPNGVMGCTASMMASLMAAETIKFIINEGKGLFNRLLRINLLDLSFKVHEIY